MDDLQSQIQAVLADRANFLHALGECITEWAYVEREMFNLFATAMKADQELSRYIFWSFPTIKMRLSYTSGVVERCLRLEPKPAGEHDTSTEKAFDRLIKRATKLLQFRNTIAHQPRASSQTEPIVFTVGGGVSVGGESRTVIFPNYLDRKQNFKQILREDLFDHLIQIKQLGRDFTDFLAVFEKERKR